MTFMWLTLNTRPRGLSFLGDIQVADSKLLGWLDSSHDQTTSLIVLGINVIRPIVVTDTVTV